MPANLGHSPDGGADADFEAAKLEALAEFAAGAGHEMNNPLGVILGRAQLLLRNETDPQRRRDLAIICSQAQRVHEMIVDLMLFARPPQLQPGGIDLTRLVDYLLERRASAAAERQIELRRAGTRNPLALVGDAVQLTIAIDALLDNAIEAAGQQGWIEIAVDHPQPATACVVVRDSGPGIPPEVRPHLFDPFFSGRAAGRGLGMGLARCWRIVMLHQGTIDVDSGPDRGATFTISLPVGSTIG
jgi:signal transduction histidine kinase